MNARYVSIPNKLRLKCYPGALGPTMRVFCCCAKLVACSRSSCEVSTHVAQSHIYTTLLCSSRKKWFIDSASLTIHRHTNNLHGLLSRSTVGNPAHQLHKICPKNGLLGTLYVCISSDRKGAVCIVLRLIQFHVIL